MPKSEFKKKIEKYYQEKKDKYSAKINLSKKYDANTYSKDGTHILELLYDGDIILKAEYELLGFYNITNSMWYWGWGTEMVDRSLVKSSEKMKDFPDYILKHLKDFDNKEAEDLHFKTDFPSFFVNVDNIEMLLKLGLYYLNLDWYITLCTGRDGNSSTCESLDSSKKDNMRFEYLIIKRVVSLG